MRKTKVDLKKLNIFTFNQDMSLSFDTAPLEHLLRAGAPATIDGIYLEILFMLVYIFFNENFLFLLCI